MALIKCPECQKEVSSESEKCIHCGFPIKPARTKEVTTIVVQQDNSSRRGLGIFFIVLGILGAIGGFNAIQPSNLDSLTERWVSLAHDAERTAKAFADFTGNPLNVAKTQQDAKDADAKLDRIVSDRHKKATYFLFPPVFCLF